MKRRAFARLAWVSILCAGIAGCGNSDTEARTQLMMLLHAEPSVAADTASLRVEVESGRSLTDLDSVFGDLLRRPIAWPIRLALVPRENDARRPFRVRVSALDSEGRVIVTSKILTSYVSGRTKLFELWLEESCRGVECGENERCRTAVCIDEYVDPTELPEFTPGPMDSGADVDASVGDAGGADGGVPPDGATDEDSGTEPPADASMDAAMSMDGSMSMDAAMSMDGSTDAGGCTSGRIQCGSECVFPNACGGCSMLFAQPNTPCGPCGTYTCSGTESVVCVGECPDGGFLDGGDIDDGGVRLDGGFIDAP